MTTYGLPRLAKLRHPGLTGVTAALGLILLALALPRAIAAYLALPGTEALAVVREGRTASPEQVAHLASSRARALWWTESGRAWTDLALAHQMLAEQARDDQTVQRHLDKAVQYLRNGLMLEPAQPHAWTRLAQTLFLTNEDTTGTARALDMAFLTGRHDSMLLLPRLELGLTIWPSLPPRLRDQVTAQIQIAWSTPEARTDLVAIALRAERLDVLRYALAASAEDLRILEDIIRSYSQA